jgi:hypothetical protein
MASARCDPLFRIAAGSNLDLAADVAAKQAARIAIGQKVTIKVTGIEDASGSIEPHANGADVDCACGQFAAAVGAFARAILNLGQSCGAAVPLSAVVQTVRSDRVETHRVATGLIGDTNVEIREGLAEGDIVVLRAGAFLRDGTASDQLLRPNEAVVDLRENVDGTDMTAVGQFSPTSGPYASNDQFTGDAKIGPFSFHACDADLRWEFPSRIAVQHRECRQHVRFP